MATLKITVDAILFAYMLLTFALVPWQVLSLRKRVKRLEKATN